MNIHTEIQKKLEWIKFIRQLHKSCLSLMTMDGSLSSKITRDPVQSFYTLLCSWLIFTSYCISAGSKELPGLSPNIMIPLQAGLDLCTGNFLANTPYHIYPSLHRYQFVTISPLLQPTQVEGKLEITCTHHTGLRECGVGQLRVLSTYHSLIQVILGG